MPLNIAALDGSTVCIAVKEAITQNNHHAVTVRRTRLTGVIKKDVEISAVTVLVGYVVYVPI